MIGWPDWCYCCAAHCAGEEQRGNLSCSRCLQMCCVHHRQSHSQIPCLLLGLWSWKGLFYCCALGKTGSHECSVKTAREDENTSINRNIHKPHIGWKNRKLRTEMLFTVPCAWNCPQEGLWDASSFSLASNLTSKFILWRLQHTITELELKG